MYKKKHFLVFQSRLNIRHKPKLADIQPEVIDITHEKVEREEKTGDLIILDSKSPNTSLNGTELRNTILLNSYIDYSKTSPSSTNRLLVEDQLKVNSDTGSRKESNLKDATGEEQECVSIIHKKQKQMIFNFEGNNAIQNFEPVVMAHSNVPLYPLKTVNGAQFLPQIHTGMLRMRIKQICAIQMYAWPHLLRNNSVFIISPSKSGKTWSYLSALCNDIYYDLIDLKSTFGPVGIVFVASMKHMEQVTDSCRQLMSALKGQAPVIVASFGLSNFRETKKKLLKSCGIVVITLSSLLRLLNDSENRNLFNGERLKRIVMDDVDLIMSRAQWDFAMTLKALFTLCKKSGGQTLIPQIAATFCRWDVAFMELIRLSNQPLLLIADYLEATVYGKVELSIKLRSKMEKKETMQSFLKKCNKTVQMSNRTIIICNEDYEVLEVLQLLAEYGYFSFDYSSDSVEIGRIIINEWKRKKTDNIFVCTDEALFALQIHARVCNDVQLCLDVLDFGECDELFCNKRHEITSLDVVTKKDDIPMDGEIRIRIILKPPRVGDICVYKHANVYKRVCILDILTLSTSADIVQDSLKLTLKLIDDGGILTAVQSNDIFICHQKFKDFPCQAINVRLINMVPYDNERVWDSKSTKLVQKWIMDDIKDNHVVHATVNFAFVCTIWINNSFVMEKLSSTGVYKHLMQIKSIDAKLGVSYLKDP
ncbi:hypothetical protein GQX74_015611 [Glossina fuscipes]|nr:hypothetical protein GQX74_015611 [Glossina fuscipes]